MSRDPLGVAAGATLTIDLRALVANWRLLAEKSAPAECGAVVKADAYGTGLEAAVAALANAGCRTFFVAHLAEGVRARAVIADATVYVLNGLLPGAEPSYLHQLLRPVLGSLDEIDRWRRVAPDTASAALHIDTGMNRLGVSPDDGAALLAARSFSVALLMSHFVSAEDPCDPINERQANAFAALRRSRPEIPASLANSSGIFLGRHTHHDLVRPGFALYGGNPTPDAPNPMRPVVRLESSIISVRDVEAGATVGYNAQWVARRPSRLATIGVGYADGYPRAASSTDGGTGGAAIVAGVQCPFAGRVSMDLIVLDVTDVPSGEIGNGTEAVLLGYGLTVDDVGRFAGTSGYEILTNLGRRYRRVYAD